MPDVLTKKQRSFAMSRIKGKNTRPEVEIRKNLFRLGFRYRIHIRKLPGCPDLVLPKYKAIIFINGCFWHYHACKLSSIPGTNTAWWKRKLLLNRKNDRINIEKLLSSGWRVLVIWECAFRTTKKIDSECLSAVINKTSRWLCSPRNKFQEIGSELCRKETD
jgi:DNA mismatch endonuclease (patch repair protein)